MSCMSSTDDKCFNKQRIISDTLFCCFCLCLVVCVNNYRLKYILVIQNLKKKHYYYLLLKIRIKIKNQQTQFASIPRRINTEPTRGERMGRKMVMVAALLATSVTVVTMMQATVIVAKTGRSPRGVSSWATHKDRPDTCTDTQTDWKYYLLNKYSLWKRLHCKESEWDAVSERTRCCWIFGCQRALKHRPPKLSDRIDTTRF